MNRDSTKESGTNVIDVQVSWKNKTFSKVNKNTQPPRSIKPYAAEGVRPQSEEAYLYLEEMLKCMGVDLALLTDWEDCVRITTEEYMKKSTPRTEGTVIYPGTLFLGIEYNYTVMDREKNAYAPDAPEVFPFTFGNGLNPHSAGDVAGYMTKNVTVREMGRRLFEKERIYRVRIDLRSRIHKPEQRKTHYDNALSRFKTRANNIRLDEYSIQLAPFDIVQKKA